MSDFWLACGHHLCDQAEDGRVVATPDLWRAFLARPELLPPEEACPAERALYAMLREEPLRAADPSRLADADARENWGHFLAFRDRVAVHPTLEAAWIALYRDGVAGIPPIFLQMLTQLVTRAALDTTTDAFTIRAAELFFRPQRVAITQGAMLLADEEIVATRSADAGFGALGRLIVEAGATPREVELDVLSEDNAALYAERSDAHDFALDIAENRPGQHGLARALEAFIGHVFSETVTITPIPTIRDWTWHVGLDAEATGIANDLYRGKQVKQARLARILWLGAMAFADPSRVLPRVAGEKVTLALAMDPANMLRVKPQNLVTGLPLIAREDAA